MNSTFMNQQISFFLPDFIEIQRKSFRDFLEKGIIEEVVKINPIKNSHLNLSLFFYPEKYKFIKPEITIKEAIIQGKTYGAKLYIPAKLVFSNLVENTEQFNKIGIKAQDQLPPKNLYREASEAKSNNQIVQIPEWVLIANLPLMTKRGHFIVNGSPRVLVNQMVRSPGVYFHERLRGFGENKKRTFYIDFISRRGAWLRLQTDKRRKVWARLKKNPKISIALFIEALKSTELTPLKWTEYDTVILKELYQQINPTKTKREISAEAGADFLIQKFKNPRTYDLGFLGRERINAKLKILIKSHQLTSQDIQASYELLKNLEQDKLIVDDIDNLKNRRVRASGELLQTQFEIGLYRLEKVILSKLKKINSKTINLDLQKKLLSNSSLSSSTKHKNNTFFETSLLLKSLISTKPLNGALREFFGSSPLSQYMDQTNPLAEVTHKRRLSSLGPGGISRDTAGMAVRGIHSTHYGRICPIETPEGKNAGLVNSVTLFGKINYYGFLQTPYFKVFKGQVQRNSQLTFFSAEKEQKTAIKIAPGDLKISKSNFLPSLPIPIRIADPFQEDFKKVDREEIDYMAVSAVQMISIATSLIPFLEHDDANRALMGSNMQRQAVPLIRPERPIVGTGLEALLVGESGHILETKTSGFIGYTSGQKIVLYQPQKMEINLTNNVLFYSKAFSVQDQQTVRLDLNKKNNLNERKNKQIDTLYASWNHAVSFSNSKKSHSFYWYDSIPSNDKKSIFNKIYKLKNKNLLTALRTIKRNFLCLSKNSYILDKYQRSNQETCLTHKPAVNSGDWVQKGDILADCSASAFGELALGQNILLAYLPWEGYNFEDAVVINERLVSEDLYTSIHIEKYEIEIRETAYGFEEITKNIPHLQKQQEKALDQRGITKVGSWVESGDILVGKITPLKPQPLSPHERLAYDLARIEIPTNRDTSLRVPKGVHGRVINIQILETIESTNLEDISFIHNNNNTFIIPNKNIGILDLAQNFLMHENNGLTQNVKINNNINFLNSEKQSSKQIRLDNFDNFICDFFNNVSTPNLKLHTNLIKKLTKNYIKFKTNLFAFEKKIDLENTIKLKKVNLASHYIRKPSRVRIYIAEKRKIQVGDKVAGRHGNKGIVSSVLSRQDMPYLPDGSIIDMLLNPLGVPSRMNVGQVFECLLGLAGSYLNENYKITPFDEIYGAEASRSLVYLKLYQARLKTGQHWLFHPEFPGKTRLFDGRTGECFDQLVTVGKGYIIKLVHLVDEKIHARSTGPYSLVTKQPLGGRSKHGGQRLGEMEVWALEGFGAAYTLQEMLTRKSDDVLGRQQVLQAILNKKRISLGNPEAFKVLIRELQSLCLDVGVYTISPDPLRRKNIDIEEIP